VTSEAVTPETSPPNGPRPRPETQAEPAPSGNSLAEQAQDAGTQPSAAPPPEAAPEAPAAPSETACAGPQVGPDTAAAFGGQAVGAEPGSSTSAVEAPAPEAPSEAAQKETEAEAPAAKIPVNPEELARTVEALLFAAEEPLAVREMARAAGADSASVRKVLPRIKAALDGQRRAWDLLEAGGGYRLVTRPEFYPAIQRLKAQTRERKLTQAALETLALIAYRQPLGRADIESIRGVGCGPVLRQLLDKKLVKISGRGTGLGHPLLYGTTEHFLEHFGLKSIEELPKPGELKPQ